MKIILQILALILVSLPIFAQTQPTDTDSDGYYNISTLDHLRWVSENDSSWTWNFELDNDIDAADTRNWNVGDHDGDTLTPDSAMGWNPIGNLSTKYSGTFEGHDYTIDSIYINRPAEDYVGFFGYISYADIQNIKINNSKITAAYAAAPLCGQSSSSSVQNCSGTGKVRSVENVSGGLVAYLSSGTDIKNCRADCIVITAGSYGGGLVGAAFYSSGISNSYCTGNVSGSGNYFGGLVGFINHSVEVDNCYSTGSVSGGSNAGGLIGYRSGSSATHCFWDTQTSGLTTSAGGTGKTTAQMKTKSTFTGAGWDFDSTWAMQSARNSGYPYLQWQYPDSTSTSDTTVAEKPTDSDSDGYYNIATLAHLRWVSENDSSWTWNFELDNDINAAETRFWNLGNHDNDTATPDSATGWMPIGDSTTCFSGKFNGRGYTIDSIYIYRSSSDYMGFFGHIDSAEVSNLDVRNCDIFGYYEIGGICGYSKNSSLIDKCRTSGKVSGASTVGGLVGYNVSSTITDCYSSATVFGVNTAGGLAGKTTNSSAISESYSVGSVSGTSEIGGLVGYLSGSSATHCFWDTQTSGQATSDGGTGKTTAEMKADSTFKDAGWDFDSTWAMQSARNSGYPYLQWEYTESTSSKLLTTTQYLHGLWNGTSHEPAGILCELRSGSDLPNSTLTKRLPGIIDSTGEAEFDFAEVADGDYWTVVRAPGYLPLGTTSKISLSSAGTSYDFTTGTGAAAGGDRALYYNGTDYLMRGGDYNGDRRSSATDIAPLSTSYGKNVRTSVPALSNAFSDLSTGGKEIEVQLYMHGLYNGTTHEPAPLTCEIRAGSDLMSSTLVKRVAGAVDSSGTALFDFGDAADGTYWIVVRAAGFLPLGATGTVTLSSTKTSYDFTIGTGAAAGGDRALYYNGTDYLMRGGDYNGDRRSSATDIAPLSTSYGKNLRTYVPEP